MTQKDYSIDNMVRNIIKSIAAYYKIPREKAARIHLMSALRQVELYTQNQKENCSIWDPRCCKDDFDPILDCPINPLGPLDPRCYTNAKRAFGKGCS